MSTDVGSEMEKLGEIASELKELKELISEADITDFGKQYYSSAEKIHRKYISTVAASLDLSPPDHEEILRQWEGLAPKIDEFLEKTDELVYKMLKLSFQISEYGRSYRRFYFQYKAVVEAMDADCTE